MNNSEISFENLKYFLGNLGIDILIAVGKGASDFKMIEIISGVPIACIEGRIPVLIDLNLVKNTQSGYVITEKGTTFAKKIEKNFK